MDILLISGPVLIGHAIEQYFRMAVTALTEADIRLSLAPKREWTSDFDQNSCRKFRSGDGYLFLSLKRYTSSTKNSETR